jgi:hypothetical protein
MRVTVSQSNLRPKGKTTSVGKAPFADLRAYHVVHAHAARPRLGEGFYSSTKGRLAPPVTLSMSRQRRHRYAPVPTSAAS